MIGAVVLFLGLGCSEEPASIAPTVGPPSANPPSGNSQAADPAPKARQGPPPPGGGVDFEDRDQGQQHPPLPADNPIWDWDAGGFVPDFGWYGENSWADVRMRVAGHLAVAARDKSRVLAEEGDLAGAAAVQADMAATLSGLDVSGSQVAVQIQQVLVGAASRDADLLQALAQGKPPSASGEGLASLRAQYLAVALRFDAGVPSADLVEEVDRLLGELGGLVRPRQDLDLLGFEDFNSRHQLRVRLFEAAFDAADPLGLDERWGYWEGVEIHRQVAVLDQSLLGLREGPSPALVGLPATRWPSRLAEQERGQDQAPHFTAEGLGWLPTGDSLIDVGAEPGPKAIGTLEKLGLEDPEHRALLEEQAEELNAALARDPSEIRTLVNEIVAYFEAMGHGSRYYNIKQVRNEAVRQLARAGQPALALEIMGDMRPLHNQDWACPNREGILLALEGRLLAEAGQPAAALSTLEASLVAGRAFLADVAAAEVAGPHGGPGRTPPMMGGPGRPGPPVGDRPGGPQRHERQERPGGPPDQSPSPRPR